VTGGEDFDVECPVCGTVTPHSLVHAKRGVKREGMEFTLRCSECFSIQKRVFSEEKLIEVPYVLSSEGTSVRGITKLFSDESVLVGEEMYLGSTRCVVTAIDTRNGRAAQARSTDIVSIWAKSAGVKFVRVSVNQGAKTVSLRIEAQPEEEFTIGDIIETGRGKAVITAIKTENRALNRGTVEAGRIVRLYAKMIREAGGHHPRPVAGGRARN
jgi:uncharacterized Zn finger protein